jgi:hypothetical protein
METQMEHNEESSLEPFASNGGGIAPGKFWVEAPSVGHYVSSIGESWRRGVTAMLDVARLCADASERLTSEQRQDLVDRLPFGQTAFSKFVTIGKDKRLDAPEVIQCLSPHYSIAYLLTGLREEELKAAIAANVVHPDMRRSDLEKWLKANRAPRSKEEPADQATVSPLSEAAQSGTPALVQTPEPVQVELPDLHVDGESHTLVPRNDTDGRISAPIWMRSSNGSRPFGKST